eukprot:8754437-Pyramimonas_sp.AAC.1
MAMLRAIYGGALCGRPEGRPMRAIYEPMDGGSLRGASISVQLMHGAAHGGRLREQPWDGSRTWEQPTGAACGAAGGGA